MLRWHWLSCGPTRLLASVAFSPDFESSQLSGKGPEPHVQIQSCLLAYSLHSRFHTSRQNRPCDISLHCIARHYTSLHFTALHHCLSSHFPRLMHPHGKKQSGKSNCLMRQALLTYASCICECACVCVVCTYACFFIIVAVLVLLFATVLVWSVWLLL